MLNGAAADMSGETLRWVAVAAIVVVLALVGIGYTVLVGYLKRHNPRFPSSVLVVIGVGFTVAGAALLDLATGWGVLLSDLVAFSATGLPMLVGDVWRATASELNSIENSMTRLADHARAEVERLQ